MSCVSSPVEEEEEVTKVRIKTLEELNATVFSIVRTTCVVGIALLLGSGSLVGSSFLTTAVFIASFYYYTSHRIPVRKFIPGFKLAKVIHASPDEIFNMYMNLPQRPMWDASIQSAQVIEQIDAHTDVIHLVLTPVWLWFIYLAPRDLVLLRYWKHDPEDGSYAICFRSIEHPTRPSSSRSLVRAECSGSGMIIAPRNTNCHDQDHTREEISSLVTAVVQLNPKGNVVDFIQRSGLLFHYMKPQLVSILGLEHALDTCKFVSANLDMATPVSSASPRVSSSSNSNTSYQSDISNKSTNHRIPVRSSSKTTGTTTTTTTHHHHHHTLSEFVGTTTDDRDIDVKDEPKDENHNHPEDDDQISSHFLACNVPRHMWGEPESGSMLVRGPDYHIDGRKFPSAAPAFRLVAMDLFATDGPIEHIANHPDNLVQRELKKYSHASNNSSNSVMPFTLVLHFIVPGDLSMVLYYRPRESLMSDDSSSNSAFEELLHDFLDGSDGFRDERFKLIPCIVEGTFVVRQAVGSTPTILGKKLRQPYYRGESYFELDIDIRSSVVANRVVGLVQGYVKKLVIDMGFLIQGQTSAELPERLLGTCRLTHLDLSLAQKLSKHNFT